MNPSLVNPQLTTPTATESYSNFGLDVLAGAGAPTTPIDFAALRLKDTMNAQPPALVTAMLEILAPFLTRFVSRR